MAGAITHAELPAGTSRRSGSALSVSVVIPTYLRPGYLVGCLDGLARQTRMPDEVVVVIRDGDRPTEEAVAAYVSRGTKLKVTSRSVSLPGFLPPVEAGIRSSAGDVVAFLDDDAEPFPDWLERLESHYKDPLVGGAGGRSVNIEDGRERLYPRAEQVGRFYWFGRAIGNMYREVEGTEPRRVDFFMGGSMSYRREALQRISIDPVLNRNVAFHYEVDVGLQVKALGYQLIYDPLARIKHYSAPRPTAGMRQRTPESVYFYSHNLLYITLKHARGIRCWPAAAYSFLVGDRTGWGLLSAAVETIARRNLRWRSEYAAAFRGKLDAVRHYRRRKEVPA